MTFQRGPVRFGVGVSGYTATLGVKDPELGTRCFVDKMEYLFVYNNSTADATVGAPVSISALTGYSVCVTHTTQVDVCVGIRQNATLPAANYGWVATRGIGTINMGADQSGVTGQLVVMGVGGFALKSNSTNYQVIGGAKLLESIASAGSGKAYFQCM
jgi:hypothetical protein